MSKFIQYLLYISNTFQLKKCRNFNLSLKLFFYVNNDRISKIKDSNIIQKDEV